MACQPELSIIIPTWNNLAYLKLCIGSLRIHLQTSHQIVVHVNHGADGTLEWVQESGLEHTYSPRNVGICHAMNLARTKATGKYLLYLNDDMYIPIQLEGTVFMV